MFVFFMYREREREIVGIQQANVIILRNTVY